MAKKTTEASQGERSTMLSPHKLELLFTVVNKEKTEFFVDLLQDYEINMQLVLSGRGTAASHMHEVLGFVNNEKSVIISVLKKRRVKDALEALEAKFASVKGGKGIAYTVPLTSTIGVAIYQFLANTTTGGLI